MIRTVEWEDVKRITEIYNYYIRETIITFEEEEISAEEMKRRIGLILDRNYPFIVHEENDKITGYAYLNNWRSRPAYNITLETSIYIDKDCCGKGIGTKLYAALIDRTKEMNLHSLIGGISLPNEASRNIHRKFGFELVGNFKESGLKFGKLIDVEFWQLML